MRLNHSRCLSVAGCDLYAHSHTHTFHHALVIQQSNDRLMQPASHLNLCSLVLYVHVWVRACIVFMKKICGNANIPIRLIRNSYSVFVCVCLICPQHVWKWGILHDSMNECWHRNLVSFYECLFTYKLSTISTRHVVRPVSASILTEIWPLCQWRIWRKGFARCC